MPLALVEGLVPRKKTNSPLRLLESILAAAGHRVRIETMIKKVNGLAALERDRHRCKQSRTHGRVCDVRAVYGLHVQTWRCLS